MATSHLIWTPLNWFPPEQNIWTHSEINTHQTKMLFSFAGNRITAFQRKTERISAKWQKTETNDGDDKPFTVHLLQSLNYCLFTLRSSRHYCIISSLEGGPNFQKESIFCSKMSSERFFLGRTSLGARPGGNRFEGDPWQLWSLHISTISNTTTLTKCTTHLSHVVLEGSFFLRFPALTRLTCVLLLFCIPHILYSAKGWGSLSNRIYSIFLFIGKYCFRAKRDQNGWEWNSAGFREPDVCRAFIWGWLNHYSKVSTASDDTIYVLQVLLLLTCNAALSCCGSTC